MTPDVTQNEAAQPADAHEMGGKFMTFKLAREEYGLAILKVRELIGLMDITRVPGSSPHIRGVINLRGKVIPVMDLRLKFQMQAAEPTDQTVIIVVQIGTPQGDLTMGVLVDEVLEVLGIDQKNIEPPPDFGAGAFAPEYLLGVGKSDKRVIFLLDIERVLSGTDRSALAQAAAA
ncbi:MAG: chemotaxis protein CheW [Myxococcaceae bacterium]